MPPIVYHHENDEPYIMSPGNVFTIEPILMMHKKSYYMWDDGLTVVSPGNPSA
jgi:methionyl aminopeptidase